MSNTPPMSESRALEQAIAALEAQRAVLGDAVLAAALGPLQARRAALQAAAPSESRKLVTVVFADLVGFTALAERRDPEDVREVLRQYFARLTAAVVSHGGQVEKYIGDAVMAVFGLPTAQEDDVERAVRAALAMQAAVAELNPGLSADYGLELRLRVGVHTGPVVVQESAAGFSLVGDTVNLASRLQSAAPENGVIISHATYGHVRGLFGVAALPPLHVRGKQEPVAVYQVQFAKRLGFRVPTRGLEGIETRTVGREAELAALQAAGRRVIDERRSQAVTVVGAAGLGKSRLMYEFDNWLELEPTVIRYFKGRALPSRQGAPYAVLRDLLSFRFRIGEADSPAEVRAKLVSGLAGSLGMSDGGGSGASIFGRDLSGGLFAPPGAALSAAEAPVDVQADALALGRLLGFELGPDAEEADGASRAGRRARALAALGAYWQRLAAVDPVVLLLEDLHWADEASLDALPGLLTRLSASPVLLVMTARPELFERRPDWGRRWAEAQVIDLAPLEPPAAAALVDELLQRVAAPPPDRAELQARLLAVGEGNPFYLEELVRMFLEEGVILTGAAAAQAPPGDPPPGAVGEPVWTLDLSRLAGLTIPATLTGLIQARFESLGAGERAVLERAAVFGRVFWQEGVAALLAAGDEGEEDGSQVDLGAALANLERRELIYRRDAAGGETWVFKTVLLRDVTYERTLRRARRAYHRRAADWLVDWGGRRGRLEELAADLADHWERAEVFDQAAEWWGRAGLRAAGQLANQDALAYLGRALTLGGSLPAARRFAFLDGRVRVLELLGERAAVWADLDELEALAATLGVRERALVAARRAQLLVTVSRYAEAEAAAWQAVALAVQAGDAATEALALLQLANAAWKVSDYERALEPLGRALARIEGRGLLYLESECRRVLGVIQEARGEWAAAWAALEDTQRLKQQLGERRGESMALNSLGVMATNVGDWGRAADYLGQALAIKREIGDRRGEETTLNNLGLLRLWEGDGRAAWEAFHACLEICLAIDDAEGVWAAHSGLAQAAVMLGDLTAAVAHGETALAAFAAAGDEQGMAEACATLSLARLRAGEAAAARALGERAVTLADASETPMERARARLTLGRALLPGPNVPDEDEVAWAEVLLAEARVLRLDLGQDHLATEPAAGLVQAARQRGVPALLRKRLADFERDWARAADPGPRLAGWEAAFEATGWVGASYAALGEREAAAVWARRATELLAARSARLEAGARARLLALTSARQLAAQAQVWAGEKQEAQS